MYVAMFVFQPRTLVARTMADASRFVSLVLTELQRVLATEDSLSTTRLIVEVNPSRETLKSSVMTSGQLFLDINECEVGNSGCEQTCRNTIGSFECLCDASELHMLAPDGRTCHSKPHPHPFALY